MKPEAETESSTEAIGDNADDLFNAYMNLDYFDALNASATEEKPDDLDTGRLILLRRVTADSTTANDGIKERNKSGAATANHFRSISMDSLIGKLQGTMTNTSSSEFNTTEMKKILANEKLAEMAETDPKRVKKCFIVPQLMSHLELMSHLVGTYLLMVETPSCSSCELQLKVSWKSCICIILRPKSISCVNQHNMMNFIDTHFNFETLSSNHGLNLGAC